MERKPLPLLATHTDLACTLDAADINERIEEWRVVTASSMSFEPIDGGRRFTFPRDREIADIARLAAAEQTCCSFFEFNIGVTTEAITLDVTGPEVAQELIDTFGDLPRN